MRPSSAGRRNTASRIVAPAAARAASFAAGARGDLRGPLLWAALLLGLIEVALASGRRRKRV